MTARIAVYLVIGFAVLLSLMSWQEREYGAQEEREKQAVRYATQWHKAYVVKRDSAHKLEVVARRAVARSNAMRDSVRVLNDSMLAILSSADNTAKLPNIDTVIVPRVVIRRLVADSVAIAELTALTLVQKDALTVADSTIAAYRWALRQTARKCRVFRVLPCPSRKTTAVLTAGTLLVAKAYLGGR